jgi:hypothetical protein
MKYDTPIPMTAVAAAIAAMAQMPPSVMRWTVGLFFSLWMVFVRSRQFAGGQLVGLKASSSFVVNSWTFAAFLACVLLLSWRRRLGQVSGGLPDVALQGKPT